MKRSLGLLLMVLLIGLFFLAGCRWLADNPMFPTAKMVVLVERIMDERGGDVATGNLGMISSTTESTQTNQGSSVTNTTTTTNQTGSTTTSTASTGSSCGTGGCDDETDFSTTTTTTDSTSTTDTSTATDTFSTTTSVNQETRYARSVEFKFQPTNQVGGEITYCTIQYKTYGGQTIGELTRNMEVYVTVVGPNSPMADVFPQTEAKITLEIFDTRTEGFLRSRNISHVQAVVTFSGEDFAGNPISFSRGIPVVVF